MNSIRPDIIASEFDVNTNKLLGVIKKRKKIFSRDCAGSHCTSHCKKHPLSPKLLKKDKSNEMVESFFDKFNLDSHQMLKLLKKHKSEQISECNNHCYQHCLGDHM